VQVEGRTAADAARRRGLFHVGEVLSSTDA
jgi:hypothetical protein